PAAAPVAAPASVPPPPTGVPPLTILAAPLRTDWTFDSLLVGAYNRFAHAAAMSVVSSPGTMYNPLFLYGVPGTGKSHMIHAIGGALSKGLGDAVLLSTSGARLSRAVNAAIARNGLAELEKKAADSKALLIDDIHLLAVDDKNKEFLAKLFKTFFDRGLQVVITSLYPPRALNALEEALKFSFSKGWSVDLKIPSPAVQKDLVMAAGDRANAGWTVEEMGVLHEKLSAWGYSDLTLWLRRLQLLKKVREAKGQPTAINELLALIYDPLVAASTAPPTPEQAAAARFAPPTVSAAAPPLAVLAPKGADGVGPFAASQFYEIGGRNGIAAAFRHALWETYDAGQSFGVPFQIGDMCARAAVTRLLLVGPGGDSPLAPRAMEFAHAVRRILESQGVQLGFIPYNGLMNPAQYLNAQLDLASDP
ncbi:MAG: DnaA/Hda family protein, partial [Elusimicrobiota bacterium]|nr:DnaA/Hda family protein [Elusimicrobiota bacterium]